MSKPVHIGQLIKAELHRQGKTTIWLASQCGCTPMNIYKIYHRSWISTDMLYQLSSVLNHNFFQDLSQDFINHVETESINN